MLFFAAFLVVCLYLILQGVKIDVQCLNPE